MKNSAEKNYHGGVALSFPLADPNQRVFELMKEEHLLEFENWEESKDEKYLKQLIFERYPIMALPISLKPELKPSQLATLVDLNFIHK